MASIAPEQPNSSDWGNLLSPKTVQLQKVRDEVTPGKNQAHPEARGAG